jgi:hypothetical protein
VFPTEKSVEGGGNVPLKMVRTNHGGHLGYIFHEPDQEATARAASWMPTELVSLSISIVTLKVTLVRIHVSNKIEAEKTVIYENANGCGLILLRKGCCIQQSGRCNPPTIRCSVLLENNVLPI